MTSGDYGVKYCVASDPISDVQAVLYIGYIHYIGREIDVFVTVPSYLAPRASKLLISELCAILSLSLLYICLHLSLRHTFLFALAVGNRWLIQTYPCLIPKQ